MKNKYFTDYKPSFNLPKEDIRKILHDMAAGQLFSGKTIHDFVVIGFNYLNDADKDAVGKASSDFYKMKDKKGNFIHKSLAATAPNDASLILKYL